MLINRLRTGQEPAIVREIARGMRRVMISFPEVAKAFGELALPADEIHAGQKRTPEELRPVAARDASATTPGPKQ